MALSSNTGVRKFRGTSDRVIELLEGKEKDFIESLKVVSGESSSDLSGLGDEGGGMSLSAEGNFLPIPGGQMKGPIAFNPIFKEILNDELDVSKTTGAYSTRIITGAEGAGPIDDLSNIKGGEFPGQLAIVQGTIGEVITIKHLTGGGNIRTPDTTDFQLVDNQNALLIFDIIAAQWAFLGILAGSSGSIVVAKDAGDVSNTLTIDFAANRFCRMRLIENLTIDFDVSNILLGKIYFLTVETLQDPDGGNAVIFADAPFENSVTPVVYTAGNRYTSIRFYAYRIDDTQVRVFAFEENQSFPTEFFDSFIQGGLTVDQTLHLNPNNHLEFDLKIASDNTISVSSGIGQTSGVFSIFKPGHLYQCECHYGIGGSIASSELTLQFYNLTKASFFGSQGRAQLTSHTLLDSSHPVAKGFFVAENIGDTIEVRVRANSGVNKIIAGVGSADPTSYVIIKDCGVAGIQNLEGNLIDGASPTVFIGPPIEDVVILQTERQGAGVQTIQTATHYTKRRCDVGSSSPSGVGNFIGKSVTHVRMQTGNIINSEGAYVAVYEGVDGNVVFRGRTKRFQIDDLAIRTVFDIPFTAPITFNTDQVVQIALVTVTDNEAGDPSIAFWGDAINSDAFVLQKCLTPAPPCSGFLEPGTGVDFPADFVGAVAQPNEAPEQRLINRFTIPGGLLNER